MKVIFISCFSLCVLACFSQEAGFRLSGRILDPGSEPVVGAYIINFRDYSVYSSRDKGRFNIPVQPGDSLVVNHISFARKTIYADSALIWPDIYLEYDTIEINQIDFGIDPEKLNKYLQKNMDSIRNADIIIYKRMNPEISLVNQTVTENNIVFRSQTASVSLVSFSPTQIVSSVFKGKRKVARQKGFTFYRNEEHKLRVENRKQKKD